jgi:hypothetical protein
MLPRHPIFRLTAAATAGALALVSMPVPLHAQAVPPATTAGPAQQTIDPPDRVGRLTQLSGAVSFHGPSDTQWVTAATNYPIAAGDGIWTEPSAGATIEVSGSRIALAGGSQLELRTLDDSAMQATLGQGEAYVLMQSPSPNEAWSLQTPRGLVSFGGTGRYVVSAGTTESPSLITVLEGDATISGSGFDTRLGPNQTASISGAGTDGDPFRAEVGAVQRDAFMDAVAARERPPAQPATPPRSPPPASVAAMPGSNDLAAYGTWAQAPDYGQVWYPQVAPGWVPYREGHWAYVAPWGWTWVDDAPWGFAPFHYGRWVEIGGRWAWTPGVEPGPIAGPPVYAPALVTFFGIGAGVVAGATIGAALTSGSVGWCPLGPREPYRPWFHASDRYVHRVNVTHVTNTTTINRPVTFNTYVNRGAATVVPTSTLVNSRPVRPAYRPLAQQTLAGATPLNSQAMLRPVATTAGITPAVARQMRLPQTQAFRPAPGPQIQPVVRAQGPAVSPPMSSGPSQGAATGTAAQAMRPPLVAAPAGQPPGAVTPATGPHAVTPLLVPPGSHAPQAPMPGQIAPGRPVQAGVGAGPAPAGSPLPGARPGMPVGPQAVTPAMGLPAPAHPTPPSAPQVHTPAGPASPQASFSQPPPAGTSQFHTPPPAMHQASPPTNQPPVGQPPLGQPSAGQAFGGRAASQPHPGQPPQMPQMQVPTQSSLPQIHPAPVQAPPPQFHPASPPMQPQVHAPAALPAPMQPQFHPAPPPQQFHPAPPPPQPQFHAPTAVPPPMQPQFHSAPPPPQVHAPPPPPPQGHQKRPGEP